MSWRTGANSWRISSADSVSPIWCAACDAFKPRGRAWSVLQGQWSSGASYQWRFASCRLLHKLCTRQTKRTRSNHVHCNIISIFATTMQQQQQQQQQIRSIVCCWVVSYLLLPGTIQAGVLIEMYKLVGWSPGWWRCWCCCCSMEITAPHSCCFLPSRW